MTTDNFASASINLLVTDLFYGFYEMTTFMNNLANTANLENLGTFSTVNFGDCI